MEFCSENFSFHEECSETWQKKELVANIWLILPMDNFAKKSLQGFFNIIVPQAVHYGIEERSHNSIHQGKDLVEINCLGSCGCTICYGQSPVESCDYNEVRAAGRKCFALPTLWWEFDDNQEDMNVGCDG